MLVLLSLLTIGTLGYLSATIAREYGGPAKSMSVATSRATAVIALARLAVLYGGLPLLRVNLIRPLGLLLFLLFTSNSSYEVSVATAFEGPQAFRSPSVLLAALVILTSIPLGFAWALVRTRPRSGTAA